MQALNAWLWAVAFGSPILTGLAKDLTLWTGTGFADQLDMLAKHAGLI